MNYSGIIYRICACGGVFIILGIILLVFRIFDSKPNKREAIVMIAMFSVGIIYISLHLYILINPTVEQCNGRFVRMYRDSRVAPPLPFTFAYVIDSNSEELNQTFYLDTFSKSEIFYEVGMELDEEVEYRIYYEKFTNIILRIECIS